MEEIRKIFMKALESIGKLIRDIKCLLGVHTFDYERFPVHTQKVIIEGHEAYLTTMRCANCGKIFREFDFVEDLCRESIVEELRNEKIEDL